MNEPRPLDAAKIDRLKQRFEQVRAREQNSDVTRDEPRSRERPLTREAARTKTTERDRGLGD